MAKWSSTVPATSSPLDCPLDLQISVGLRVLHRTGFPLHSSRLCSGASPGFRIYLRCTLRPLLRITLHSGFFALRFSRSSPVLAPSWDVEPVVLGPIWLK